MGILEMAAAKTVTAKQTDSAGRVATLPNNSPGDAFTVMHGRKVSDPYRWLNDSESKGVKVWTETQNKCTREYLDSGDVRSDILKRLAELEAGAQVDAPVSGRMALPSGEWRYFQFRRMPGDEHKVLYYMDGIDGEAKIALDPNKLSRNGKTALIDYFPNDDGTLLAFATSKHGNDETTIRVLDVETGKIFRDTIDKVTFASIAWAGNEGFYYTKWPDLRNYPDGKKVSQVYYHKLGTPQAKDLEIFGKGLGAEKSCYVDMDTNGHYLFISVSDNVNNDVYYKNLHPNASPEIKVLVKGIESEFFVMDVWDTVAYALTSKDAPNYRIVSFNINSPSERNWRTVIAERDMPITGLSWSGHKIVIQYGKDAYSELKMFSINGRILDSIDLPMKGHCTVPDMARIGNASTYGIFEMSSPVHPPELYKFSYNDFVAKKLKQKNAPQSERINMRDYEFRQVWCESKDGTQFPMFMINKKGIARDGNNPVVLYGYGGFNTATEPEFDHRIIPFLQDGGVWCMANIRGGGEYGRDWYFSGINTNKQNSYDDFISAAEWLIKNNYTNSNRLAIRGRSNGGLLTAAVMAQRPDLFKAVISEMPLTDMLSADRFDIGPLCKKEYGDPEKSEEFESMMKYSPYHNIKKGERYPSLLVIGGEYDTRCDPLHARKFAAMVQDSTGSDNPALLLIQRDIGHGGSTMPVRKSQQLEWTADWLTFIYKELGMEGAVHARQLQELKRSG